MRLGMEKNFLFGVKNRIYDPDKGNEVMLTGGIWQQAGRQFNYTVGSMSENTLIELTRKAFTGNGGSSKKLLIGGTMLIEQLNKLDHVKVVGATETMTRWGLDFTEIITKFGKLYVLASEVFDQCGHANDGMILDPEYMTKYCHVAFRTERLDLRKSGIRNTDAIVITEASCLVLRYPDAHLRVVGQ
jgi:alpha-tubulin suppressor-like RCC1 family protein